MPCASAAVTSYIWFHAEGDLDDAADLQLAFTALLRMHQKKCMWRLKLISEHGVQACDAILGP